jgi:DNA-directed RNA polymerase specialized sigma24 family protein
VRQPDLVAPSDTARLWRRWRRTQASSTFEEVVRPEVPYARDFARRLGATADEADDAVQDALLLLARERSDDPWRVGLRAWLCRRVALRVKMRARAGSRRRRRERTAAYRAPVADGDPAAPAEMRDEVHAALAHLDAADRRIVVLPHADDHLVSAPSFVVVAGCHGEVGVKQPCTAECMRRPPRA